MTALHASCPACGAEVTFKSGSSIVVVCEYCNSVVARTDRALEDLGRVAEVVASGSPLDVGLRGTYRGTPFELTGHAQLAHPAGGMWDEWYAAFDDGRWGWLAEAQGRFYLTYRVSFTVDVPPFDALEAGRTVTGIPVAVPLVVAEKGEARMLAARGEIPYRLIPGEVYAYADVSGPGGVFGTIDYGERPPAVFVGREVTLAELGIVTAEAARPERAAAARRAAAITAAQLQCPQCAGPLELRVPDQTERVTCPNCGSLLDLNQGRLRLLKSLEPGKFVPSIPIGAGGVFHNQRFTVIGFVVRSVEFEGVRYLWQEYLLYNAEVGFRWLVESDHHWSFVEPVAPGEIVEGGRSAHYRGRKFKVFQDAVARVEYVAGEFYWKVTTGELVRAVDYVRPPEMLSKEISGIVGTGREEAPPQFGAAAEVNWSLGTYVPRKNIERTFGVSGLKAPSTVAPNQPFRHSQIYGFWALFLVITVVIGVVVLVSGERRRVFEQTYQLQPSAARQPVGAAGSFGVPATGRTAPKSRPEVPAAPIAAAADGGEGTQIIFTEPFELSARQNLKISARSNVDNSWLYVAGDLINEETGLVQQFELPIEYYYGIDGGESWTEGDREREVHLSALPAGMYTMRLEAQWESSRPPPPLALVVQQGVPRLLNLFLALLALSVMPVLVIIHHFKFERRRWADSAFNPFDSDGGNDE